jgi:hypothetical protein
MRNKSRAEMHRLRDHRRIRAAELAGAAGERKPDRPAVASWAGLNLTAVDVGNLRLAMMGLLPNLAGLVLAFGVALAATHRGAMTSEERENI